MSSLEIALVQTATHWHDPEANRRMFDAWLVELPKSVDLVVLPEMFSTGFTMHSREVAEPVDGPTSRWLQEKASTLGITITGSVVIRDGERYFNRMLWARPDGSLAHYDKRHRFRMAGEHEHYDAGADRVVVELGGWRILLMVCYDLRFPVFFRNRGDYDAIVCVANWPAARQTAWNALLKARAIENLSYAAGVNRVGVDGNDLPYSGGSAVYDFEGAPLAEIFDDEALTTVTLDKPRLDAYRNAFPAWQDADDFVVR